MCARNQHGGVVNPLLDEVNMSLDMYKNIFSESFTKQLSVISMCGNFGDPILNNNLIDMVSYVGSINSEIRIDIHTNGSARNTSWWVELANSLPKNHLVHFALDGLEDTHSIYRIGTDYNKIIENCKAFINAGGKARWVFITFKHNEHQLEQCRELSKVLGFESFQEKQTSRFIGNPWFPVYNKEGETIYRLEPPSERKLVFISKKTVENYREIFSKAVVSCDVIKSNSIYVDSKGNVYPCCFTGGVLTLYSTPGQYVNGYHNDSKESMNKLLSELGSISLNDRTMEQIVDSNEWQTLWDKAFTNNSLMVCSRTCGKYPEQLISQSRDQFIELKEHNE
jgi:MoaA/NifB/PqqE/SkfB family radical SAM enzyme